MSDKKKKSWRFTKEEFEEWCDNFLYERTLHVLDGYDRSKQGWLQPCVDSLGIVFPDMNLHPPKNKRERSALIRMANADMDLFSSGAMVTDRLTICRYALVNSLYDTHITAYTYLTNAIKNRSVEFVKELCFITGGWFSFQNWNDAGVELNWDLLVAYPKSKNRFQILKEIMETDPDPDRRRAAEIFVLMATTAHEEKYAEKVREIRKRELLIQNLTDTSEVLQKIAENVNIPEEIRDFGVLVRGRGSDDDYTPKRFLDYLLPRLFNIYTFNIQNREIRRLVREALYRYKMPDTGKSKKDTTNKQENRLWKPVTLLPSRLAKDATTRRNRAARLSEKKEEDEAKLKEWYAKDPKIVIDPASIDWYSILGIHNPTRRDLQDFTNGVIVPNLGTSGYLVRQLEEDAPKPVTVI